MKRMIAVLACLLIVSSLEALSVDEARLYMAAHPEEAAQDIATWDAVEHATPVVVLPAAAVLISGLDVHVAWQGPADVRIATLHYAVTCRRSSPWDRARASAWWTGPAWAVGGAVVGGLTVALLVLVLR